MTLRYSTAIRNAQQNAITTDVGASGLLRIYTGAQPASVATAASGTLLGTLTCNATFAPASVGGVLTLNAVTQDSGADADGTAGWFRFWRSDGVTGCIDGSITATGGGGDMTLNTVAIVTGGPITLTSGTFTRGNT